MKKLCQTCCQENASSAVVCGFCLEPFPKATLSMMKTLDASKNGVPTSRDTDVIEAVLKDIVLTSVVSQKEQSVVYSAKNILTKAEFIVKVQQYETQQEKLSFLERCRQLQRVEHSAVMKVLQFGPLSDGRVFVVSEPLTGQSLRSYIKKKGKLSIGKATALGCQIAAALEVVHAAKITHGNLRPENIYLRDLDGKPAVTLLGFRGGKTRLAEYVSPEQAAGQGPSARSDVYSLGVILFEMLTGRLPFLSKDINGLLAMQREGRPPLPSSLIDGVPSTLDGAILHCLEKSPDDRSPSAAHLKRQLSATLEPGAKASPIKATRQRAPKPSLAVPFALAVLGGLVACSIFAIALLR